MNLIGIRVKNTNQWEATFKKFKKLKFRCRNINNFHMPGSMKDAVILFSINDLSFHVRGYNYFRGEKSLKDKTILLSFSELSILDHTFIDSIGESTKMGLL